MQHFLLLKMTDSHRSVTPAVLSTVAEYANLRFCLSWSTTTLYVVQCYCAGPSLDICFSISNLCYLISQLS